MIGVVVWSSADREKAVIWCEDQGALAYLQGRENLSADELLWPEAGDLLELETELVGPLRHARKVMLISEKHCPQLPAMLRGETTPRPAPRSAAQPHLRLVASQATAPLPAEVRPARAMAPAPVRVAAAR